MRISDYFIRSTLHKDATGATYMAVKDGGDVEVQLIVLGATDEGTRELLLKDLAEAARLDGPLVVRVRDCGLVGRNVFYAQDVPPGRTLAQVLEKTTEIAPERAAFVALGVARALEYAQAQGVRHGALAPEFIHICDDGRIAVSGFGVAAATSGMTTAARYQSTEDGELDAREARTDVYALGAIIYRCLRGEPPTSADAAVRVLEADSTMPRRLVSLVARMLAPGEKRMSGMAEVCAALTSPERTNAFDAVKDGLGRAMAMLGEVGRSAASRAGYGGAFAALALLAVVLGVAFALKANDTEERPQQQRAALPASERRALQVDDWSVDDWDPESDIARRLRELDAGASEFDSAEEVEPSQPVRGIAAQSPAIIPEPEATPSQAVAGAVEDVAVAEREMGPLELAEASSAKVREIIIQRAAGAEGTEIFYPVGASASRGQLVSAGEQGVAILDRGMTMTLPWAIWEPRRKAALASALAVTGEERYEIALFLAQRQFIAEAARELDRAVLADAGVSEKADRLLSMVSARTTTARPAQTASQAARRFPEVHIAAGSAVLPVVADSTVSGSPVGSRRPGSAQANNGGGSNRLKIKRFESLPVMRFDFSALPANATVTEAVLEVRVVNDRPLNHVGTGTLHVPWNEGTADNRPDPQGICFFGPRGPESRWREGLDEGDFNTVTGGNGGDANGVSRAVARGDGWLSIPVDPYVIHAAREHGQSLVLTDETGIQEGPLTNAFIGSRLSGASAPRLRVTWETRVDNHPPEFLEELVVETGPLPGTVLVRLPAVGDDGREGRALGYRVRAGGRELPKHDIPRPSRNLRTMLVRDLPPGRPVEIEVTAFDKGGNTVAARATATARAAFTTSLANPQNIAASVRLPRATSSSAFSLRLADGLTLFDPITGGLSPKQTRLSADAPGDSRIVPAVRGEIVELQALVHLAQGVGSLAGLSISASNLAGPGGAAIPNSAFEFHRQHFVKMGDSWVADILPVLRHGETFSIPSQENIPEQRMAAIYIDIIVDKDTPPGVYTGEIVVAAGRQRAASPIAVLVRDLTIPDELSFVVEMNAYGHTSDLNVFHETYRLLHKHRLGYNVVGYGHVRPGSHTTPRLNTDSDPSIPGSQVRVTDWTQYERFYGPILSGEIARDLPRKGVPASHWYLPFHCGWPYPLSRVHPNLWEGRVAPRNDAAGFRRWADRLALNDPLIDDHFDRHWRDANAAVARQFREFFASKGWSRTSMQIFNNHKYYFDSGSISLWTMDEPQYVRDFRALDLQYHIVNEALAGPGINTAMRSDISRPQFMGDRMDRSTDLVVIAGALDLYPRLASELVMCHGATLWWYGGVPADVDPASYVALFLSRWSLGCDGGMPVYTTFAGTNSWDQTDSLRVVRFDPANGLPVASFRMKAYRRAQQDMELLNMLAAREGWNRWHLRDLARTEVPTRIVTVSSNPDDPGFSTFEGLNISSVTRLREKVVATLMARYGGLGREGVADAPEPKSSCASLFTA